MTVVLAFYNLFWFLNKNLYRKLKIGKFHGEKKSDFVDSGFVKTCDELVIDSVWQKKTITVSWSDFMVASSSFAAFSTIMIIKKTRNWWRPLQVNICQKLLFLPLLTHIMTTDCSLNYHEKYKLSTSGEHVVYKNCSECQNKNKKQFLYTICSQIVFFLYWSQ